MIIQKLKKMINEVGIINHDFLFKKKIRKKNIYTSPNFLIIGAAKSGTTSLFQYLANHPAIMPPIKKEVAFFTNNIGKGLDWYLSNFPLKSEIENKITFEATPGYLFFKKAPVRVHRLFPNIKCIVLLRNPVERAYSHWAFYQKGSKHMESNPQLLDSRSFEDAVEQELNTNTTPWIHQYIARGRYAEQLKRWYKYFPKENILILDSVELKLKPNDTLGKVAVFLQIPKFEQDFNLSGLTEEGIDNKVDMIQSNLLKTFNATNYKKQIDPKTKADLKRYYAPFNKELEELVSQKFSW